jgi:hypothetical protein
MFEHDARRCTTQSRVTCEYGLERNDIRNVIEDQRRHRRRTSSPPRQSLVDDVAPMEKSGFCGLAGPLR